MRLGVYEAFQQALIHLKAERLNEAVGSLHLAASAWPDVAEIRFLIGCVEERAGNHGQAADAFRKALALDPAHASARECLSQMTASHFRLGLAREAAGAVDEAAAAYGRALQLDPAHGEAAERLKRLAMARIGEAALEPLSLGYLGRFRAEQLDLDARTIGVLAQKGQTAQAAGHAVRTLAFGWPDEDSWRQAREAALRLFAGAIEHHLGAGQLDQARVLLQQALPWVGDMAPIQKLQAAIAQRYRMQAEARRRSGDLSAATDALRSVLAAAPGSTEAKAALEALLAERVAAAEAQAAAAKAADAAGNAEAAVAAWTSAARVAPDPDDYLRAMSERRYRAYNAAESTLVWPGIGRVLAQNQGPLLTVRALDRPAKGWALVPFLREHVVFDDDYEHFWTTSIHWESREVCRILLELGYDLHVINEQGPPPPHPEPYKVAFGSYGEFLRLRDLMSADTVRIGLLTGSAPSFLDRREAERIAAMLARRPGAYAAKRSGGGGDAALAEGLAATDHALLIGNAQTLSTYPDSLRSKITPIHVTASPMALIKGPGDSVPREREFLWYFGRGAALKGLDLVLEAFARQDVWTLNVVGLILDEPDFIRLYGAELFHHPRIRFHGHLRGNAPEMTRIARRSVAFVAPSASEGMSNACATCMTVGLYPILSRTTGIDLPDGLGIYLEDCSIDEIAAAIGRVHAMDEAALGRDIARIQTYALDVFGRAAYAREMRRLIPEIIAAKSGA